MSGSSNPVFLSSLPLAAVSQGMKELTDRAVTIVGDWLGGHDPPKPAHTQFRSPSARLRAAFKSLASSHESWRDAVLSAASVGGVLGAASQLLSPTGPGGCDHNPLERCCNCATSVPYMMVGIHALMNRETTAGKAWGASMLGVGTASLSFHSSPRHTSLRTWCRRADFWSIAISSNLLLRAVYPDLHPAITVAGIALTPFRPFFISFLNSTAMELKFLARAYERPELAPAQRLHAITCLGGLGVFALEDMAPHIPLTHSAWHILSSLAVGTVNALLEDVEQEHRRTSAFKHLRRRSTAGGQSPDNSSVRLLVDAAEPLEAAAA